MQDEKITEMYLNGGTVFEISNQTSMSPKEIADRLFELGLNTNKASHEIHHRNKIKKLIVEFQREFGKLPSDK